MNRQTLITLDDGRKFEADLARIDRTELGFEDHGMFVFWLHCSWSGGSVGQGVGGFRLDDNKEYYNGVGLELIKEVLRVVGVPSWEKLGYKQVLLLRSLDDNSGDVAGIAHPIDNNYVIFRDHFAEWKEK